MEDEKAHFFDVNYWIKLALYGWGTCYIDEPYDFDFHRHGVLLSSDWKLKSESPLWTLSLMELKVALWVVQERNYGYLEMNFGLVWSQDLDKKRRETYRKLYTREEEVDIPGNAFQIQWFVTAFAQHSYTLYVLWEAYSTRYWSWLYFQKFKEFIPYGTYMEAADQYFVFHSRKVQNNVYLKKWCTQNLGTWRCQAWSPSEVKT